MDLSPEFHGNTWALVLAGGDSRRGPSLLEEALERAAAIAPSRRICTIVAAQHRQWWTGNVGGLPQENVIVQPQNRGTGHGILLALLKIESRDPAAVVVLLPADHHLRDEEAMAASLRHAAALAAGNPASIYLLGAEPDEPDTDLGYIVPASRSGHAPAPVLRFIDRPSAARARALLDQGAVWNTSIVAASVRALLGLFGCSFAPTIAAMRVLRGAAFDDMYQQLRSVDFAHDLLRGNESKLEVLPVPNCGWSEAVEVDRVTVRAFAKPNRTLESFEKGVHH